MKFTRVAALIALASGPDCVSAFADPSTKVVHRRQSLSSRSLALRANCQDDDSTDVFQPLNELSRQLVTTATSALLASSLLFSNPLIPPPEAQAAAPTTATSTSASPTATSIDIDLKGVSALTRKAIINRDALSKYLIESAKSFEPILRLLSESDSVTIKPPQDIKGAIKNLASGEAQFLVNDNNLVDVRVESVPGAVIVRVINPNIPKLPFLKDGTESMKFVEAMVDAAPAELESAAKEVEAFERFLTWGAPERAPIQFKGSSLDYFLKSKFLVGGKPVSLGVLGDLNNSEVLVVGLGSGMVGVYAASYAYYVKLRDDADREAAEKKEAIAAAKKAKASAAAAKKAADAKKEENEKVKAEAKKEKPVEVKKVEPVEEKKVEPVESKSTSVEVKANDPALESSETAVEVEKRYDSISTDAVNEAGSEQTAPKRRKRDAFKKLFKRGD